MAEKKTAKKVATSKKTATKISIVINAENVGFKAGDVYQTLATANKALSCLLYTSPSPRDTR